MAFDILPRSCPNPFSMAWFENINKGASGDKVKPLKGGKLPAAIVGSGDFDVMQVDVSTLLLNGISPIRHNYEDVSTPVSSSDACACTTGGADGFMDLTLKFSRLEIATFISPVQKGDEVELTLTGSLLDGSPFEVSDCIVIVGKRDEQPGVITDDEVVLNPAVPNPFNPTTRISYYLPKEELVNLAIFNVAGKLVQELVGQDQQAGEHVVEWNAAGMPSGIYFCRMRAGGKVLTKKLVLLK